MTKLFVEQPLASPGSANYRVEPRVCAVLALLFRKLINLSNRGFSPKEDFSKRKMYNITNVFKIIGQGLRS